MESNLSLFCWYCFFASYLRKQINLFSPLSLLLASLWFYLSTYTYLSHSCPRNRSFSSTWTLSWRSTIYWKVCLFSTALRCQRWGDKAGVGRCVALLFLHGCSVLRVNVDPRTDAKLSPWLWHKPSSFFLLHLHFRLSLSSFIKKKKKQTATKSSGTLTECVGPTDQFSSST